MDMTRIGSATIVRLSRRNLLSLLTKLDWEASQRTIFTETPYGRLEVTAEEDEKHYAGRTSGEMHPDTERDINNWLADTGGSTLSG